MPWVRACAALAAAVAIAGTWPAAAAPAASAAPTPTPTVDLARARRLLPGFDDCADVACLIERAYSPTRRRARSRSALWNDAGDVAGVGPDEMHGRRLPRQDPPGAAAAARRAPPSTWSGSPTRCGRSTSSFATRSPPRRRRAIAGARLAFRFVRSVGKRTPSAYADGWAVEYNVEGSLLTSAAGVRETLFHELFHTNDEDHGDWSASSLQTDYDAILAQVRPAEQPLPGALRAEHDDGARRHLLCVPAEQRQRGARVRGRARACATSANRARCSPAASCRRPAFKCGPAENGRAWSALVDEFFAGRDRVPACPPG